MRRSPFRITTLLAVAAVSALALAGCAGTSTSPGSSSGPTVGSSAGSQTISADRCASNRAAGTITYVTGFQYQSSASILPFLAAKELGYFDALCLTVEVQPGSGDTAGNAQLVAAGTATVTDLGSDSDLLLAQANGVGVTAVATYGQVPITTLMTGTDVTDLKQLEGTTLGQKGQLPAEIAAMLVADGVDVAKINQVVVGYDPTVLPRGQVQSLTGYKSNEPLTLKADGDAITEWNPEDYGIPGTFGTVVVNPAFALANRTATEDFLRAAFHAYGHCESNADECVGLAAKLAGGGDSYDTAHNVQVWQTETALVAASRPAGAPLGALNPELMAKEVGFLVDSGQLATAPDTATFVDPSFVAAISSGSELIWPAP
ncbi:ABC transporter substrate-binding protein [Subtercola sp. Z020]|uniref:ABC transporter substrate-binding protein n=1 Tax=Subtercola sp. Z020 TaxID=2080582 RepID=UPI001E5259B6|nr:ABC transporter substrate-binding protein [Subtercola sp. Z020]